MIGRSAILLMIWLVASLATFGQTAAGGSPASSPCADARQRQLDFWVGEWDLTWPGEKGEIAHGTNHITQVLGSCVVQESFSGDNSMSLRGMSVSTFDVRSGRWKQTWVDNEGSYLDFVGQFDRGQMVFQREAAKTNGTKVLQRMVYKNITPNEFDWSWERSLDDGKTWQVMWPIHYQRKKSS
jgi:Protein of unknown function (DUF1579)